MFDHKKVGTSRNKDNLLDSNQLKNSVGMDSNSATVQKTKMLPQYLRQADIKQLQKTTGNQAVCQLMKQIGLINGNSKYPENNLESRSEPIQKKENKTGLPENLKARIENLTGLSMDDVRVHYNSSKPEEIGALAYTQGADIHVAPEQQKHLSHEAWHVVQQKQGRVKPTIQMKSYEINDDAGLEREADLFSDTSFAVNRNLQENLIQKPLNPQSPKVLQGKWVYVKSTGEHLNLRKTDDPEIFSNKDGLKYRVVEEKDGEIFVEKIEDVVSKKVVHKKYRAKRFHPYLDWTNESTGKKFDAPFGGKVSATHKRGAPKIGSQAKDYGGEKLGDTYTEYIRGLRSNGKTDQEIAEMLLTLNEDSLTELEKRAGDMLHMTVYLAEEWRKQGAGKLYRGFLYMVRDGKATLDNFEDYFKFIVSAQEGRKEVGRFRNVTKGISKLKDLPKKEKQLYDELSDMEKDDFSSDEEMRKKKETKIKRLF